MPKITSNDNSPEAAARDEVWVDGTEAVAVATAISRYKPKWRTIEQYWEERRLREHLKDYLADEE